MRSKKIKIVCLYQVIMHYRVPFYEAMARDERFNFKLFYGRGKAGTKLVNTKIENSIIEKEQLFDFRIPMPFSPSLFFKLIRERPDVVFTEGSSSLINASIAFLYAKIFRRKIVWWSLGSLKNKRYRGLRGLINKWELFIERRCDAIFTYSTQGKNYFLGRGVPSERIFVAVNVFDTSRKLNEIEATFEPEYLDKSLFNIGFIGTIEKTKNLELLIDVVKDLNHAHNNNIGLHIIGDGGYLKELQKYNAGDSAVTFYGRMNQGSSKILGNCDVFVLPGLGGLAICEGMLNKLPIVTGNADGTEYDLVGESNGFVIEEMTAENLKEKIHFLYKNPAIRSSMGEQSFRKITLDLSFQQYYSVFKNMILKITT